jgi:hypothetical protein
VTRFGKDFSMTALRVVLGLVVLWRSCAFVFAPRSAEAFARTGLPDALRLTLGWCEIVAAVLFLIPRTLVAGAWSLVAIFLLAGAIHVLHGEYDVTGLAVWAVAALAVLAHRPERHAAPAR